MCPSSVTNGCIKFKSGNLPPILDFPGQLCSATVCLGGPLGPLQHGPFPGAEQHGGLPARLGALGSAGDARQPVLPSLCLLVALVSGNLGLLSWVIGVSGMTSCCSPETQG